MEFRKYLLSLEFILLLIGKNYFSVRIKVFFLLVPILIIVAFQKYYFNVFFLLLLNDIKKIDLKPA